MRTIDSKKVYSKNTVTRQALKEPLQNGLKIIDSSVQQFQKTGILC
jgi:hypothetical protein